MASSQLPPSLSLYTDCGAVLRCMAEEKRGIRAALYDPQNSFTSDLRRIYALVSKVSPLTRPLVDAIRSLDVCGHTGISDEFALAALAYDLCLNEGKKVKFGGRLRKSIESFKQQICDAVGSVASLSKQEGGSSDRIELPRYVRVRTHIISAADALTQLSKYFEKCEADPVLSDIIRLDLSSTKDLLNHPLVTKNAVVLQDKSGALSGISHRLHGQQHSQERVFMDVCSAPGNKALHLLDLLEATSSVKCPGTLLVCEQDQRRGRTLTERLTSMGQLTKTDEENGVSVYLSASKKVKVHIYLRSFFDLSPEEPPFNTVTHMNLDPSCSGSGMPTHFDEQPTSPDRLKKLAAFQAKMLRHALNFPALRAVCYSTCSLHTEENMGVVLPVLSTCPSFALVPPLKGVDWVGGQEDGEGRGSFLVADPRVHQCRGFFLARLERKGEVQDSARQLKKKRPDSEVVVDTKRAQVEERPKPVLAVKGAKTTTELQRKKHKKRGANEVSRPAVVLANPAKRRNKR